MQIIRDYCNPYLTAQLINLKKSTTTKRIWIFKESSSAREGYDKHLGARINQQGHDLYEISDNYKDEKTNVY